VPDDDGGDGKDSSGGGDEGRMVLKEGQDMKFLVIEEDQDEHGRPRPRRISARRVSIEPRGSVKFFDVICRGAVGTVLQCPQCHDAAHALDQHGRIRLRMPVHGVTTNFDLEEPEPGAPTEKTVTEVYLSTEDSPGGKFSFHGGQYVGLWIQVGDTLLFDIVQDYSDGACRAVPTAFLTPPPEPIMGQDMPADVDTTDVVPSVRIVDLTLAGRAEGVVRPDNSSGNSKHSMRLVFTKTTCVSIPTATPTTGFCINYRALTRTRRRTKNQCRQWIASSPTTQTRATWTKSSFAAANTCSWTSSTGPRNKLTAM